MLGWLLAALAALVQGGTVAAHDVSCWHSCNTPKLHHCSWPPLGPAGNTSYVLNLCFEKHSPCRRFEAGTVTNYNPPHDRVFIFENTTAWVEARWGDQVRRTPNHTLYLSKAVKLDPPPTGMPFSKTGGQLRVQVPQLQCHGLEQLPQHEARFWRVGDSGWTQVTCETVMMTGEDVSVTCALGVNGTFVVQLRHKYPHWSSYWSDWSSNISVPEEILRSPVLSHQLGKLGRDGQRVLRLSWQVQWHPWGPSCVSPTISSPESPPVPPQPVLKEQRNVIYKLDIHMLACDCAEPDEEEDPVLLGWDKTEHNLTLSGAEYEILLRAVNAAGPGPAQQLRVPAEQRADLSFKEISVAGGTVTAQWEAPVPGDAFCFEQQTLPGPPKQGECTQQEFPANSSHVQRGKGTPQVPRCPPGRDRGSKQSPGSSPGALRVPGCHRLAVHGWDAERGWATFALWHRYHSNDSLFVPINISSGDVAVVLQWTPSPRASCPGALAKYLICHGAEGDNVTYSEVNATASNYTLQNLQPGTTYRVGVSEVPEDSEGTCRAWWRFQTKALGPQGAVWRGNLKYLGILLGVPASAAIYHLTKKRAGRLLFPPLPKPAGTKAIQFSDSEMSQGQPRRRLLEPMERFNAAELLLEPNPSEETTDTDTQTAVPQPDVPQPGPALEKPEAVVVTPLGCGDELPFAYRKQDMLSPLGSSPSGSTSCSGHRPGEEEEEEEEKGRQGLHQPLIPIALLISDKPIIIRDEEGWDPSPQKSVPWPSPGWSSGAERQEGHGGVPWHEERLCGMQSAQYVGGTGTCRGFSGFRDTERDASGCSIAPGQILALQFAASTSHQ
ncbi:interleukin-12 receptor subunit beta-1 isoform X4 [Catharus ustulatus]|uniref:interleukin-12 receptor subunit beta-1 isoform X4 n=1 Tax=Catharus ustulatus TaxID=91951 RepID=UPI00140C69CE|nr:interleukin-12 receptor subunit beta-1 isoform X4 [Catharus ustulatus]